MKIENGGGASPIYRFVEEEREVRACFPLMRELRIHLDSADIFVERWRRQAEEGYRLLAGWIDDEPIVLAGFRILENLFHGRHLYVDDLVTVEALRCSGHGREMLNALSVEGRRLGCAKLLLDTPVANFLGHRFYYRNGLLATAFRFNKLLPQ